jgi:penicillin amidase
VVLAAALWVGARPTGAIPPLGQFFDPWRGVWTLAAGARRPDSLSATIGTLTAEVRVVYDDRGVPHIFASNELDALRALGYAVAQDRLFQLELQTRAALGTLTELFGARAIEVDRDIRRLGLPWGAERKFRALEAGSDDMRALEAYADGVNAYIDQLSPSQMPFEYRLLNRQPQRWRPEYTMALLVRMGYTLAYSDFELVRPEIEGIIGGAATDALFPRNVWVQEPIQPNTGSAAPLKPARIPAPLPDSASAAFAKIIAALRGPASREFEQVVGSNSWVVAPSRSATGHALLANDPHLELSLPSIWYEAHIVVRDSMDVYGATFPGAPSIVLGLNRDVAWGATNVGADVADYYVETVDDSVSPRRYMLDGAWRDLELRTESYFGGARMKSHEIFAIDTLRFTHRGPMMRVGKRWISMRWVVLEPSNDFAAFRRAQHARSVRDYFDAMSGFRSPAQNFTAADRGGHIAIRSTGAFPRRSRGDRLFDGAVSASDWKEWIAVPPQAFDPGQGFAASANQQPADPRVYADYLGNEWPSPWRAMRINTLLRNDSSITADEMRQFQTDPGSARADAFVPFLLAAARSAGADSVTQRAASLLAQWDRRYTPESERAALFEIAMRVLALYTWDELAARDSAGARRESLVATPNETALLALMHDSTNVWWDRLATAPRETRDMTVAAALREGLVRLERERGPEREGRWRWSQMRFANIWHALRVPAMSALDLSVQGGTGTLNPSSGNGVHGASWRLVAELGPKIRAWGTYPGGQSANPISAHFRDRIETWRRGELDSLRIPRVPADLARQHTSSTLLLAPGAGR